MATLLEKPIRETIKHIPLVQWSELSRAPEVASPEKIPEVTLEKLWHIGFNFTFPQTRYFAIAYTEIPDAIFSLCGLGPQYKRIVYVTALDSDLNSQEGHNSLFTGKLLINPRLVPGEDLQCDHESCGSITNAKTGMWLVRPRRVQLSASIYGLGYPKILPYTGQAAYKLASYLHHELYHLDGLSGLNLGWLMGGFGKHRYEPPIAGYESLISYDNRTEMTRRIGGRWLSWDPNRQKIIVLGYNGEYIRDYPTPNQLRSF